MSSVSEVSSLKSSVESIEEKSNCAGGVRHLSIWKIKVKKVLQRLFSKQKKLPSSDQMIEKVVDVYNKTLKDGENNGAFQLIEGIDWDPDTYSQYAFKAYHRMRRIETKHTNTLIRLGATGDFGSKTDGFIYFYHRLVKKNDKDKPEIVALTTGKTSWEVVINFVDFRYSTKIAKRILDPDQIQESEFRDLIGPNLKSASVRRLPQAINESEYAYRICTKLKSRCRERSSLLALPPFQNRGGTVAIRLTKGSIRIYKDLDITDFPRVLHLFSIIDRKKSTHLSSQVPIGKTRKVRWQKTQEEELDTDKFSYLDYTQPVLDKELVKTLQQALLFKLWTAYSKKQSIDLTFCHRFLELYLSSTSFRLLDGTTIIKEWSEPESAKKLMEWVEAYLPKIEACKSFDDFDNFLKSIKVAFHTGNRWIVDAFASYLEGMVNVEDQTYFKVGKTWYRITIDLLTLLDKQYYDILRTAIIKEGEDGFHLEPWSGTAKRGAVSAKKLQEHFNLEELQAQTLFKALKEVKISFITNGKVNLKILQGEILKNSLIQIHREAIEKWLSSNDITEASLQKELELTKEHTKTLWAELTKERSLLVIPKKTKGDESDSEKGQGYFVAYPFLPEEFNTHSKSLEREQLLEYLKQQCSLYYSRMKEGPYNELHLFDKMNKGEFYEADEGYLLGDRICPRNIEIFDVAQFTLKKTFVCHNKEGFGQPTRDALSQLRNSAQLITDASANRSNDDILSKFWEEAVGSSEDEESQSDKTKIEDLDWDVKGKRSESNTTIVTKQQLLEFLEKQKLIRKVGDVYRWTPEALNYQKGDEFKGAFRDQFKNHNNRISNPEVNRIYTLFKNEKQKAKKEGQLTATALKSEKAASKLYRKRVKDQLKHLGKENFRKIFSERELVYVYAFLDKAANVRTLAKGDPTKIKFEKEKMLHFKNDQGKAIVESDQLMKFLLELKYVEDHEESFTFTNHFLRDVNQEQFVKALTGWLNDSKLNATKNQQKAFYSTLRKATEAFGTTIAKFEIVTTFQIIQALGPLSQFKIYQIRKPESSDDIEETESDEKEVSLSITEPIEKIKEEETFEGSEVVADLPGLDIEIPVLKLRNQSNSCYLDSVLEVFNAYGDIVKDLFKPFEKVSPVAKQFLEVFSEKNKNKAVSDLRRTMCTSGLHHEFNKKTQYEQLDAASAVELFLSISEEEKEKDIKKYLYENNIQRSFFVPDNNITPQIENEPLLRMVFNTSTQKKHVLVDLLRAFFERHEEDTPHKFELDDGSIVNVDSYEEEIKLTTFPEILVLQLKRFVYIENKKSKKIVDEVTLPDDGGIDLSAYAAEEGVSGKYEIVGFIRHEGASIQAGHYIANVKIDGKYWECNDMKDPKEISEEKFYGDKRAYLVFLKKVEDEEN